MLFSTVCLNSLLQFPWTIWKYRHQHGHCKNFILHIEVLIIILVIISKVYHEAKHPWGSPFQVALQAILEGFSCCFEELLCRKSIKKRNFKVDVISAVLKTQKPGSSSLQVCKFMIRNAITDHFQEIFVSKHLQEILLLSFTFSSVANCIL